MFNILCVKHNTDNVHCAQGGYWVLLGTGGYVPVLKITQSLTCCDPG